jgi:hypothetical protein
MKRMFQLHVALVAMVLNSLLWSEKFLLILQ